MPERQIKIFIGYFAFMLLLVQAVKHSTKYHDLLESILALFGSLFFIGLSIFGLQNGWVIGKFCTFDREDEPISFWIVVALQFAAGGYLIYLGVTGLMR